MSEVIADDSEQIKFLDRAGLRGFPWVSAGVLYLVSYCWFWGVRNSFWIDDWTAYVAPNVEGVNLDAFGLAPWTKFVHLLYGWFGPGFMRLCTFIAFFLSVAALFGITKKFKLLDYQQRKFVVLLFLLLPFNSVRVALHVFHYSMAYLWFFVAWYLLVTTKSVWARCASLCLFFLSFQMHSLLSFFALPCAHLLFLERVSNFVLLLRWARKYSWLLCLPFVYWVLRALFWPATIRNLKGDGYHEVTSEALIGVVPFLISVLLILENLILLAINRLRGNSQNSLLLVVIGLASMFFAVFAYVIDGSLPGGLRLLVTYLTHVVGRDDWQGRHLMLQPFGVSLVLVGLISFLPAASKRMRKILQQGLLAVCILFNVCFGFEYIVDYSKQQEIVRQLEAVNLPKFTNRYVFIDQTTNLNARGRYYRDRDWWGLIGVAYDFEFAKKADIKTKCYQEGRIVLINGPETHWRALKNWIQNRNMGFVVKVDDTPNACTPDLEPSIIRQEAIPILFYFVKQGE